MGHGQGLPPQPQQQPPLTLQLQDHGQGSFLVPRGGPQAEYIHQPYREQPHRDREAARTRKLLPQAPGWLISTPPRWSQEISAEYGEVDLRWALIQPYCREGFFIPNLARTSFAEWKAGRRMPRVIPMGRPEGLAFKEVRPRVKPDIKGPVPHETNTTGMGGVYGSQNQLVDPTAERVIQEMAAVPRWLGEPSTLDEWEEKYDGWREGYGQRFDEREHMDLTLSAIVDKDTRERHAQKPTSATLHF